MEFSEAEPLDWDCAITPRELLDRIELETSRQPDYETALARALDYFDLLLDTTLAYIGASEED